MKQFATLSVMVVSTAVMAAEALDSADAVLDVLSAAGYTETRDVEMDDGLWEVEVRGDDGRFYDLHVVPGTGAILDKHSGTSVLSAEQIRSSLESKGYTKIDDLDLDDAVWEAEAVAADGTRVDLTINGFDGEVLHSEIDD